MKRDSYFHPAHIWRHVHATQRLPRAYLAALIFTTLLEGADVPRVYRIETVAGSSSLGDGGAALAAQIGSIQGIAVDRFGNIYLSDTDHHRVRKIAANGIVTTIAGTGSAGFAGDGGPASASLLNFPYGLATDLAGYVYIADLGNHRVRRVSPDGIISTIAGNGKKGFSGDGGLATEAQLLTPRNLAVDSAGNLYISEFEGHRVRKVAPDGKVSTVAGIGIAGFRGDGGLATAAQIGFPAGLAVDRNGVLYLADSQNQRVRKIVPGGAISTVVGGSPGTALQTPLAVAVDLTGNLYVSDSSNIVRTYSVSGVWSTVAGTGASGFNGDGLAAGAQLTAARDLAVDISGFLYIADGIRIRRVDGRGQILTIAGDAYLRAIGDGGLAVNALLLRPAGVALDAAGNLYIADSGTERVRRVSGGMIRTVAGTGIQGSAGDQLHSPMGVVVDGFGNILIADTFNHRIKQLLADGRLRDLAGTGVGGSGPELLAPSETALRGPRNICTDRTGALYIVDTSNHRLLRAPPGGLVATVAGNGSPGDAGDGGSARLAQLNQPGACALDTRGNLFIADTLSHRIRKVTAAGVISTVAGTGTAGFSNDEGPATAATLDTPRGVAVNDNGDIFIADTANQRIRQLTPDGVIHTIAGEGIAGWAGDNGPAIPARIDSPAGLILDGSGNLYFADTGNNRIRRLVPGGPVAVDPVIQPPVTPAIVAVHAASLRQGPVAPGEILTIYGQGIGPESGVLGADDPAGLVANSAGGSEVRFDGIPAAVFYAQSTQINVQVPYTVVPDQGAHVEVYYLGKLAASADLAVVAANPGLFPVAVNQDGSINSETSPAARGSLVTFYGTGAGVNDGPNVSGQKAQPPYPRPLLPVILAIAGIQAELLYAGSAPGFAGMLQINARVPGGFVPPGQAAVELQVGNAIAPPFLIWVK